MIAHIHGAVESIGKDNLIVNLGSLSLRVFVPTSVRDSASIGHMIDLATHLQVREDAWILYGFAAQEELELFELLLGVSGVGARTALAVLGVAAPEQVRSAIAHEQAEVLTRVPGIGKKTAEAIIFHLRDKVGVTTRTAEIAYLSDIDTEVIAALTGLGYSVVEAQTAIASLPRDGSKDVEERLKQALAYFAR
jgi:Holliday junction DNA helicase RuvA